MNAPHFVHLTRRELIKNSSLAGAGMLAFPYVMRGQANNDNSLIRVGLIGCGGRGSGAADQTLSVQGSNVKLTAIADAFESKVEKTVQGLKSNNPDKVDLPPERCFHGFHQTTKFLKHGTWVFWARLRGSLPLPLPPVRQPAGP